jgi:hypothetical protein
VDRSTPPGTRSTVTLIHIEAKRFGQADGLAAAMLEHFAFADIAALRRYRS